MFLPVSFAVSLAPSCQRTAHDVACPRGWERGTPAQERNRPEKTVLDPDLASVVGFGTVHFGPDRGEFFVQLVRGQLTGGQVQPTQLRLQV